MIVVREIVAALCEEQRSFVESGTPHSLAGIFIDTREHPVAARQEQLSVVKHKVRPYLTICPKLPLLSACLNVERIDRAVEAAEEHHAIAYDRGRENRLFGLEPPLDNGLFFEIHDLLGKSSDDRAQCND
jgi:hypothetical protein